MGKAMFAHKTGGKGTSVPSNRVEDGKAGGVCKSKFVRKEQVEQYLAETYGDTIRPIIKSLDKAKAAPREEQPA